MLHFTGKMRMFARGFGLPCAGELPGNFCVWNQAAIRPFTSNAGELY
jgi:hypothetical protein